MKKLVRFVAKNKFFHLFLGSCTILAGLNEVWDSIYIDIITGNIHSGHGVILIGACHFAKSLGEFIEGADYLEEGLE